MVRFNACFIYNINDKGNISGNDFVQVDGFQ